MDAWTRPTSKAAATAEMYRLAGEPVLPLGPGSKEKRSSLEALGRYLRLDVTRVATKRACGRVLAQRLGVLWDSACYSAGDTITLEGLNRLLEGALVQGGALKVGADAAPAQPRAGSRPADMEDSVPQDESELQRLVAAHISSLSQRAPLPNGVVEAPAPVASEDVVFEDGSWRTHLVAVQSWLNLPIDLDGSDIDSFDVSLRTSLRLPASAEADEVLPRLAERLERALFLRARFVELLDTAAEGGATLETASQEWATAWEEVEEEEATESGGPIHAEADTWPVTEFVQLAADDELELSPSWQRADVWPTGDSQMLIESVLRGIPLPSIIILQRSDTHGVSYEVVDGKQRLTSLLRFVGKHPHAVKVVRERAQSWGEDPDDMVQVFQRDYPRYRKVWKKHETQTLSAQVERELHFPFPLRSGDVRPLSGELEAVRGKYYSEVRNVLIDVVGDRKKISSVFEQQSRYKLPVIKYTQVTSEQIHEVFSLYNKQGKHLNAEEIRNALFHHTSLMRALLVTAGDSSNVESVAPFLVGDWDDLSSTPRTLERYGFGAAGYKRTKLLSWVTSVLVHEDGNPEARSTANQINALLKRVADDRADALRKDTVVTDLMLLLDHGLDTHAAVPSEIWASKFRNSQKAARWQELQLVATLVGFCAVRVARDGDLSDLVESRAERLHEATLSEAWKRPDKTQSREQWLFIARVVRGMLELFDVDVVDADKALRSQFGHSGLAKLVALRGD